MFPRWNSNYLSFSAGSNDHFPTTLVARGIQTLARKSSTSDDRSSFLPARFFLNTRRTWKLYLSRICSRACGKSQRGISSSGEERRGESCSRIFITGHEQRRDKSKNSSPRDELGAAGGVGSVFVTTRKERDKNGWEGEEDRGREEEGVEGRRTLRAVMNTGRKEAGPHLHSWMYDAGLLLIISTPYRLWLWTSYCWWPTIRFAIGIHLWIPNKRWIYSYMTRLASIRYCY